ncbi:hypothetical protein HU200_025569 [Digitaria exilis]|uniref:Bifunctional inhibitor/plant lipid transfer protein/seed storage helical domain-containing protein n=1 Tax=Digitaria exilis TaxID=1010633 RepID=A0A835C4U5_9POAL|nr:hypothetical protein HU200_025569 [Digitaria exilis]CAB3496818.1 unnamed protein product [Digitaria exilis]
MARPSRALVLALAALVVATAAAAADTPAPAPGPDCMGALVGLAGCLSYVEEGSTVTTPDPSCCLGLKDVVRHQVACLCQLFQGGGPNFSISLNMTKALQLPAACKVKTPPVSKCHVSVPGVPSASPVPAPSAGAPFFGQSPSSPAPSGSPAAAAAATGSDSNNTPAPSPAHTGAASLSASSPSFFSAAAAVAVALLAYRIF